MLLLGVEPCSGGEYAYDLLIVSVSMSIHKCEKVGSTPEFKRYAKPNVTEFRQFYLTVPRQALSGGCETSILNSFMP
jgi:hypothetical protein